MDIPRKNAKRNRAVRRIVFGFVAVSVISAVTLGTSRLKPAAPLVEASTIWPDTVRRGEMVRQVRGLGTLVSEEIFYIPAPHAGRVEAAAELPGVMVTPETVLVTLKNPDMEQQVREVEWSLVTAESDLASLKAQMRSQRVGQRADMAALQAQYRDAKARNDRDEVLFKQGLMLELDYRLSKTNVEDLGTRIGFEQERAKAQSEALDAQLDSRETAVKQLRATLQLRRDQVEALSVRAGVRGTLQQVLVQVGQQVGPGTNIAIVVEPNRLKASLAIAETQAKDVLLNQKAEIDTQNGIIPGRVVRINPTVLNGTRTVDVKLEGALPPGAVPDKSVDGIIEIERLENVIFVGRPISAQAGGQISLFRITADGREANRVKVKLGKTSVNTVEIVEGLSVGDKVILSDLSSMDAYERIRLK